MEGVVGEYAYAAAPDLADAPGGAGGLLRRRRAARLCAGCVVPAALPVSCVASELRLAAPCMSHSACCMPHTRPGLLPSPVHHLSDDYDDDGGFGGDDDYYDAESELPGEDQEGQAAAAGGEEGAVDQVGNGSE